MVFFHFDSNFNSTFCKQSVETLIRRHILPYLIWVCTVCLCPKKKGARLIWVNSYCEVTRLFQKSISTPCDFFGQIIFNSDNWFQRRCLKFIINVKKGNLPQPMEAMFLDRSFSF